MYRRLKATADAYITNKIISNDFRATDSNTGEAATLDLFKIYDENSVAGDDDKVELSRILIKFDLNPLRALTGSSLDISDSSFTCKINLYDVFGGQTLPSNFTVIAFPLSQSFDEGVGRDVIKFQDIGTTNFLTASVSGDSAVGWFASGANAQGGLGTPSIDIMTTGTLSSEVKNLFATQVFTAGTEDLSIDVTTAISGVLSDQIPDCGFRLSFSGTQETDEKTRFVKRFGSRHNSNTRKRPRLIVEFNDTIQDHHDDFLFNVTGSIFLNNYERGSLANIIGSPDGGRVTGSNSLLVNLVTGSFSRVVTGSQHQFGPSLFASGVYSASFAVNGFSSAIVSGTQKISDFVVKSGSITFTTFWQSLDHAVGFHTGSLTVKSSETTGFRNTPPRFQINIADLKSVYKTGQTVRLRCVAFDADKKVKAVKTPIERKSAILTKAYYRVRDAYTDEVIVPFEETNNSTLMSTDTQGMYFDIYTDDLEPGRVYAFDVKVTQRSNTQVFKSVGGTFRIEE
jgi:hypothetical protein